MNLQNPLQESDTTDLDCSPDSQTSCQSLNPLLLGSKDGDAAAFITELSGSIDIDTSSEVPDMWSWDYIGLYCQYASIGLLYGSTGALLPFCAYTFNGESNVCANARSISTFGWNLKVRVWLYEYGCMSV
jgi:hypothetical protein